MNFDLLLQQACPSIQYRIKDEILKESIQSPIMQALQREILNDPLVRQVFSWQQSDGWIGWMLAFTQSWRTKENLRRFAGGVKGLIRLTPIPSILLKHKSQLVAPASFCMLDFNPDLSTFNDSGLMM
jgi:hypothetical protein